RRERARTGPGARARAGRRRTGGGRERPPVAARPGPPGDRRAPLRRHPDPDPHSAMTPQPRIAVCPGSYDPITYEHFDVIRRAAALYDQLIVAVVNAAARNIKAQS